MNLPQVNEWMKDSGWQNSAIRQADLEKVARVVLLAQAAEREACAKTCEEFRHPSGYSAETPDWEVATYHCAAAIRARSNTKENEQ